MPEAYVCTENTNLFALHLVRGFPILKDFPERIQNFCFYKI